MTVRLYHFDRITTEYKELQCRMRRTLSLPNADPPLPLHPTPTLLHRSAVSAVTGLAAAGGIMQNIEWNAPPCHVHRAGVFIFLATVIILTVLV